MPSAELISALRDAHQAHLTSQLQDEAHWRELLAQASGNIDAVPLGKLVDSDTLVSIVDQWLQQALSAQGLQPVITDVSLAVWEAAKKDPATVGELLREDHFEIILEQLLTLQELREKAVHAAMNHPMVSDMVSEMLYSGINNFMQGGALAKIPGFGMAMKMGRKAMGGMEDTIRDYLRKNIKATLKTGEQWLNKQLTNERIEQLARDGYRRVAPMKPADVMRKVPNKTVKEIIAQGCAIGDESSRLDYTRRLISVGIHAAVESLSDKPLQSLLDGMKISQQSVHDIAAPALAKGAAVLIEEGVLAPFIQWVLDDFYQSDACKAAVEKA